MDGRKAMRRRGAVTLLCAFLAAAAFPVLADAAQEPATSQHGPAAFATINGKAVAMQEFETAFIAAVRQKFYHGKIPDGQLEVVRQEVSDRIIVGTLLRQEAERRGLVPEAARVDEAIAVYEGRYAASPMWQQNRERLLPGLRDQIGQQNVMEQLERSVRAVPNPGDDEVRAFYAAKTELFTEPEKLRLSVILLKVDPSSPKLVWDKAREEAETIRGRIRAGTPFGELARVHSADDSSAKGGDMGYLHRGMLPEVLQEKIDQYQVGVVPEPVTLLEGVALIRVEDKVPAKPRTFDEVAGRARDLLRREREDKAWNDFIASLRAKADIRMAAGTVRDGTSR